jgi:hypothetical protein
MTISTGLEDAQSAIPSLVDPSLIDQAVTRTSNGANRVGSERNIDSLT